MSEVMWSAQKVHADVIHLKGIGAKLRNELIMLLNHEWYGTHQLSLRQCINPPEIIHGRLTLRSNDAQAEFNFISLHIHSAGMNNIFLRSRWILPMPRKILIIHKGEASLWLWLRWRCIQGMCHDALN